MRRRFSGKAADHPGTMFGFWTSFEQCENAMRAERINIMRDEGKRVFGDDGPNAPGNWHEIDEAITPHGNGIDVRTIDGKTVRIYAYDASEARQK